MTERQFRNEIVKRMTAIGTYREQFEPTIKRLAQLYVQCEKIEEQFIASGGNAVVKHTNKAGATNAVKNPYLGARDEVYTQLLAHERELGLTPAALKKMGMTTIVQAKKSTLADALKELGG